MAGSKVIVADSPTALVKPLDQWPDWLKADFEKNQLNGCIGTLLLSESKRVRVWEIRLDPGERLPFHRHVLPYLWVTVTPSQVRSHYLNGAIEDQVHKAGDTMHNEFGKNEFMVHDLQNIGKAHAIWTTIEYLEAPNRPLEIPSSIRRAVAA